MKSILESETGQQYYLYLFTELYLLYVHVHNSIAGKVAMYKSFSEIQVSGIKYQVFLFNLGTISQCLV